MEMRRATKSGSAALLLAVLPTACASAAAPTLPAPYPTTGPAQRHLYTFDTFWDSLADGYLYVNSGQQDWLTLGAVSRPRVESDLTDAQFEEKRGVRSRTDCPFAVFCSLGIVQAYARMLVRSRRRKC